MEKKVKRTKILEFVIKSLVIIAIFFQFGYLFLQNSDNFLSRGYSNQYETYRRSYYESQYAKKKPTVILNDEAFEGFAGGAFLKGLNPIHIVHDHPPLGRYIVSLSILLFDNPKTIILFALIASFVGVYLTSKQLLKNFYLSVIPLAIFANEPLTISKLFYAPLPEPIHLPFIIFAIYFFIRSIKSKHKVGYYLLFSIMLGFVISIRFFVTGGVVLASVIFCLLIYKEFKNLVKLGLTLPLSLVVLWASYTRTIMDSHNLFQVLSVQKYILAYHKSAFTNAFSFWDLLIFNRWHTWWDGNKILSDPQWILFWPFSAILTGLGFVLAILRKIKITQQELVVTLWVSLYCLMLSTGYTSTRYFFPILPYFYILATVVVVKAYGIYRKKDKKV